MLKLAAVPRKIVLRPKALADERDQTAYIAADDPDAAERFLEALETAYQTLLRHPELGRPWTTRHPEYLLGVRRLILSHFPISIFYRPTPDVLDIIRILHHSRDFPPELDI